MTAPLRRPFPVAATLALSTALAAAAIAAYASSIANRSYGDALLERTRIGELEARLSQLERQGAWLLESATSPTVAAGDGSTGAVDDGSRSGPANALARLAQRIARLDALAKEVTTTPASRWTMEWAGADREVILSRIAELRSVRDEYPELDWMKIPSDAMSMDAIRRLRSTLADAGAPFAVRLDALRALRDVGIALGVGLELLDEGICATVLGLLAQTSDDALRDRALSQIQGRTFSGMRQPLIDMAVNDASPDIRDRAVSALTSFLPHPDVERVLHGIAANDADAEVRDEAEEALKKGRIR